MVAWTVFTEERPSRVKAVGLGIGFAGVALLLGPWRGVGSGEVVGNLVPVHRGGSDELLDEERVALRTRDDSGHRALPQGRRVQLLDQRADRSGAQRFELHPGESAQTGGVILGLLGAELYKKPR